MHDLKTSKTRLFIVFSIFLVALSSLLGRLVFFQLIHTSKYASLVEKQSNTTIELQPTRGCILDRGGHQLALDIRLDSLYAVSRDIENKEEVASKLNAILGTSRSKIMERLERDKLFVWIERKLPASQTKAIKNLNMDTLGFIKESQRMYPKRQTASHLIGFTDIDNNGLQGIELDYNSFLKGIPGWCLALKDAKQRVLISRELEMVPPVDGYNIYLTIDEVIQSFAENELAKGCKKYNAKGGSIIVMEPTTGDILAMASYPSFDLGAIALSDAAHRRNRAITDIFEPGSVFKMFTLAGILEHKALDLNQKIDCEKGSWAVAGRVLHDHHGEGILTLRQVIERSSNIGTVKAAMQLGEEKLYDTFWRFGFGKKTNIGLSGEVSGILPSTKVWSRSSIINIPIGQGVAVTPLQLATAVGAIANDGVLMKPRIISSVEDMDGRVIRRYKPESVRRVISENTARDVRSVLAGVVSRQGTGFQATVEGFQAAGKTGTAQKILADGSYSHNHFIASFVGFVPYDKPKLIIAVSIDEPRAVYYGGVVAAPVFSHLARQILSYWQLQPTEAIVTKKKAA